MYRNTKANCKAFARGKIFFSKCHVCTMRQFSDDYSAKSLRPMCCRYQMYCMEQSRERITTKARQRNMRNQPALIKYITNNPMSRSWSEIRLDTEVPKHKERRRTELLEISKQSESEAMHNASLCAARIVKYGEPIAPPAVKLTDKNTGTCQWVLSCDKQTNGHTFIT